MHNNNGFNAMLETTTSEARRTLERIDACEPPIGRWPLIGAVPAPMTVSNENYSVSYFKDHSILIWSRNDDYIVLDGVQTYYRDTVEHLARSLGNFTQEQRAEMVGNDDKWVDGIHWSANGEYLGM
jgi:hypothetical protein